MNHEHGKLVNLDIGNREIMFKTKLNSSIQNFHHFRFEDRWTSLILDQT